MQTVFIKSNLRSSYFFLSVKQTKVSKVFIKNLQDCMHQFMYFANMYSKAKSRHLPGLVSATAVTLDHTVTRPRHTPAVLYNSIV